MSRLVLTLAESSKPVEPSRLLQDVVSPARVILRKSKYDICTYGDNPHQRQDIYDRSMSAQPDVQALHRKAGAVRGEMPPGNCYYVANQHCQDAGRGGGDDGAAEAPDVVEERHPAEARTYGGKTGEECGYRVSGSRSIVLCLCRRLVGMGGGRLTVSVQG